MATSDAGVDVLIVDTAHGHSSSVVNTVATLKKELIYRISAYRLSMAEVKSQVFRYVFVYYNRIRVYTANPGGWPRGGQLRVDLPNNHLQYAFTWFGIAACLVGVFSVFALRRLHDPMEPGAT